ncbi:hypothetical protein IRJ41_004045 [Triplophysa rosa]|uniref:Uncharacterized protein n=1 Tax=Triplophysa rosa TaxID=992332 RepID=A0A9W7W876_TRIRA|nr:hypothetical protein IRJ41_004045 [Triplophysa rosa]
MEEEEDTLNNPTAAETNSRKTGDSRASDMRLFRRVAPSDRGQLHRQPDHFKVLEHWIVLPNNMRYIYRVDFLKLLAKIWVPVDIIIWWKN